MEVQQQKAVQASELQIVTGPLVKRAARHDGVGSQRRTRGPRPPLASAVCYGKRACLYMQKETSTSTSPTSSSRFWICHR